MTGRETPGATTRLIIDHVRRRAGDDAVAEVLERAQLPHDLTALVDDSRWFTYDEKVTLLAAAADVLDDPLLGRHVGESAFEGEMAKVLPALRALGSPGALLRNLLDAAPTFCPTADMEAIEIAETDAVVRYRLHDPHRPDRHDCGHTAGLLSTIACVFGLPPAEVSHPMCQVDGADACLYHIRWLATPKRRRLPRRTRRSRDRTMATRFWRLERDLLDLVGDGDPSEVLERIATSATEAVGGIGHLLVITDPDGANPTVLRHGVVGGGAALLDEVVHGMVDDDEELRVVVELATPRHRYGHLIVLFDDTRSALDDERTILQAYGRHAAAALDAAAAINAARVREETASLLLELSRSLADLTTVEEVAARVADAVPAVLGAQQAAVLLYDQATRCLRTSASSGVRPENQEEVDAMALPVDAASLDVPSSVGTEPTMITRAGARGFIADLMDRHDERLIALAPIRVRGRLRGMISCGWRTSAGLRDRDVIQERLVGIADQTATALENAILLEQVRHQALHDALTGLPNQSLFADRVATEILRAKRSGNRVAVGVLDLDRFKTVNDSLGHNAGDRLLVQVAERLTAALRGPDTVARMGGDEFTLLLPDLTEAGEAVVAERILEAFVQPFEVEGHRLRISPSIGLAVFPEDGDELDQLLRRADVAMYRAKERGRNTWATYATGMAERAFDRLTLENDLYRALQQRELRVAYLPIARPDGTVVGTEALVRWAHPSLGMLLPGDFLAIAEDLGLMAEIDGWVLRQACLELGSARASGSSLDHVAVNVSARTVAHPALERLVDDALAAGGLDPRCLVIEVSEAAAAEQAHVVGGTLPRIRARGVRVSLDDFGRGNSALSHLEVLPIDRIKVDAAFLAGIDHPGAAAPVVEAIVAMGHGLGFEVCAEGVETDAQQEFAARVGFDLVQGWVVGRPRAAVGYAGARSRTA